MKVNFFIGSLFLSFIAVAIIANINDTSLIGCTELNGSGCVCHSLERDSFVRVWVEGPESLFVGQTGYYKMFMAGGPAEAGGYNVAGRFGEMVLVDSYSVQHPLALNELTQAFSLPFPTQLDTIYWSFGYKVLSSSSEWDTIYSCGLSLVWDSIPDFRDRWNFGLKFPIKILSSTDIKDKTQVPDDFVLYQNYPNPFNPSTKIKYSIPTVILSSSKDDKGGVTLQQAQSDIKVSLKVYDMLGNEVQTLINEYKTAGKYEVEFNGGKLPSGIYFYKLESGSFTVTKKMLLLK